MIPSTKINIDRIVGILQGNYRPEPEEAIQFGNYEIEEAVTRVEQYHDNPHALCELQESVTIAKELESLLPLVDQLVNHISEYYPDHKILFASRDGELLYDAFRIKSETQDKALLFPGSKMLISDLEIKAPRPLPEYLIEDRGVIESRNRREQLRTLYKRFDRSYDSEMESSQLVNDFLASYGINEGAIKRRERFLLVDTGFKGTVAAGLKECIQNLYSLEDDEVDSIIIPRLVGTWGEKGRATYIAKELMPFDDHQDSLKNDFPKTEPVSIKYCNTANFCIALAMQFLPHYHGPFFGIDQQGRPQIHRIGEGSQFRAEIDTVFGEGLLDPLNTSIVNPLGALIVQRRVAQYFLDRS